MTQGNSSINSHITAYLDYYCGLSHAPRFAVLLKGQWGSGKTWFIEEYIKSNEKSNQKYFYISLYGKATLSEIEDEFFRLLHPIRSSKGMEITEIILKGLLKGALKIDLNGDGKDDGTWNIQIPDIKFVDHEDINKSILIFDDLERCKIDLSNLLGYINSFVEHQDLKVILVANEEEIFKNTKNEEYSVIKEKLIGKNFEVSPDFKEALISFINLTDNQDASQFISNSAELKLIREVFACAKYKNLRVLRQIILDFERIFKQLPEKAKEKPEFLRNLLEILIVFSIKIKRGSISPKDISKLEKEYIDRKAKEYIDRKANRVLNRETKEQANENQEGNLLQAILDKYFFLNLLCPSVAWWQKFFDLGIVDKNELDQSIYNSQYFQNENTHNWVKLWHFHNLSDDNFNTLLKQVESEYNKKELSELGEIKHVTGLFLNLSDIGLYSKNKEDILKDAKRYIDWLKDNKKLTLNLEDNLLDSFYSNTSYKQLGFYGKELEEFKSFCSYIDEVKKLATKEEMPRLARELLTIMKDEVWKFVRMICLENFPNDNSYQQIYAKIPIFKYIKTDDFVNQLLSMIPENQRTCLYGLKKRYEIIDDINKKLLEELDWLKSVQDLLTKETDSRKGQLSGYLLTLLIKDFNEAIERLTAACEGVK